MDLREKNSLRWEEDIQSVWQEDCCPNHRWQDRSNWWDEGQAAPTRAWVAFKRCNLLPVFHPPLNAWTPGGQRLLIEKGWGWEEWAHLAPGPAGRTTAPLPPWQTPPSSPREASMLPNFLFFSSSAGDVSCRWYRLLARKWQRTTAPPNHSERGNLGGGDFGAPAPSPFSSRSVRRYEAPRIRAASTWSRLEEADSVSSVSHQALMCSSSSGRRLAAWRQPSNRALLVLRLCAVGEKCCLQR